MRPFFQILSVPRPPDQHQRGCAVWTAVESGSVRHSPEPEQRAVGGLLGPENQKTLGGVLLLCGDYYSVLPQSAGRPAYKKAVQIGGNHCRR